MFQLRNSFKREAGEINISETESSENKAPSSTEEKGVDLLTTPIEFPEESEGIGALTINNSKF